MMVYNIENNKVNNKIFLSNYVKECELCLLKYD